MTKHSLSEVWMEANRIQGEVEEWLRLRDVMKFPLQLKPLDRARLLKLKLWETRYKISIQEMLDIVIPILRRMTGKQSTGLGVRIANLTGKATERILQRELEERYPHGENESVWRETEREKQLLREELEDSEGLRTHEEKVTVLGVGLETFVKTYHHRIERGRERYVRATNQRWRRRKSYRGNCW